MVRVLTNMEAMEMMGRIAGSWKRKVGAVLHAYAITVPQFNLLRLARRRGPVTPSAAARELGFDRPTLTVVLRACVKEGWLERNRSKHDGRSARLFLTGAAEELLDAIEAAKPFSQEAFGDALDVLDGDERASLLRSLDRIRRRSEDLWG